MRGWGIAVTAALTLLTAFAPGAVAQTWPSSEVLSSNWASGKFAAPEAVLAQNEAGDTVSARVGHNGDVIRVSLRGSTGAWTRDDLAVSARPSSLQLAVDPTGGVTLVWRTSESSAGQSYGVVHSAYRPAAGTWGPVATLHRLADRRWVGRLGVAVDSEGRAAAVWDDGYLVYFAQRGPAAEWSTYEVLGEFDNGEPDVASPAAGEFAVTYLTGASLRVQTRSPDGTWSRPETLYSGDTGPPNIAADAQGNTTVAWYTPGTPGRAWTARQPAGGGTWTKTTHAAIGLPAASTQLSSVAAPGLAASGARTAVAWVNEEAGSRSVQVMMTDGAEGGWSAPVALGGGDDLRDAAVAVGPSGELAAAWRRTGADETLPGSVEAARTVAGAWTPVQQLSEDGWVVARPRVAYGDQRGPIVVWGQFSDTHRLSESRAVDASRLSPPPTDPPDVPDPADPPDGGPSEETPTDPPGDPDPDGESTPERVDDSQGSPADGDVSGDELPGGRRGGEAPSDEGTQSFSSADSSSAFPSRTDPPRGWARFAGRTSQRRPLRLSTDGKSRLRHVSTGVVLRCGGRRLVVPIRASVSSTRAVTVRWRRSTVRVRGRLHLRRLTVSGDRVRAVVSAKLRVTRRSHRARSCGATLRFTAKRIS